MANVSTELFEALLYEQEGVTLDFKRDQYAFIGASDEEKSELLKDILAFANSWRRTDAFIAIGVAEAKGTRATVVGVQSHIDDATLQQFVNAKTQRPLHFSYVPLRIEGKDVALIHIPSQDRPFYLNKAFGRLKEATVYVRRGSSTDIALPDEIARMGAVRDTAGDILLDVFCGDPAVRGRVSPDIRSVGLTIPDRRSIPDYREGNDYAAMLAMHHTNAGYYRELAAFTRAYQFHDPLYLAVTNAGTATAHDLRIETVVRGADKGVSVMDENTFPDVPRARHDLIFRVSNLPARYDTSVERVDNAWVIQARADKVQPTATVWFRDPFYVGATASQTLRLEVTVCADNLPAPHRQVLEVPVQSSSRTVDLDDILEMEHARVAATPGYKQFMRDQGFGESDD
jgi:Schlafen, AlbA_2